jgi:hypothetical protein
VREVIYLTWPEATRGLLAPFWQKANVRGALAIAPAKVTSFGVGGIDFGECWRRVQTFVGEAFPPAAPSLQLYVDQFQAMFGVSVPVLLDAVGPEVVSYTVAKPGGMPSNVILLSLRNGELIRRTVANIEKRFGQRLLLESVDAVPIFGAPPPAQMYFAVCERYLGISQDMAALRDFVRSRRGHPTPLAGRPDVRDILKRADLAGLSYVNLGQQLSILADVGTAIPMAQALEGKGPISFPVGDIAKALREGAVNIGDVWTLLFVEQDGISYEIRSDCGMLPFGVSAGSVVGSIMVPAAFKAREQQRENDVLQALRSVAAAQEIFRARNGRYAQNLWELRRAMVVGPELGRGLQDNYLFKVKSSGADNWACDARPVGGRGRFFYCDHTGIIRAESGGPARSESPVATGFSQ